MIVKIERYEEGNNYWLADNIKKISVSKYLLTRMEHEKYVDNISILDYWNSLNNVVVTKQCDCTGNVSCSNCCTSIRLICRSNDGEEFSILFDTIAYILNDNGKTIERVVANYQKDDDCRTARE